MGKQGHHEEHVNHERWVISFADMMTLLFALFVVLYAIGETKLRKLKDVKKSIAFAFNFAGSGKTQTDGLFDKGEVGGELMTSIPLVNTQKGAMKEFLLETLPQQFEEKTGKSLEIVINDDTIAFSGPMSAFFQPGGDQLKPEMTSWIGDAANAATTFASHIRVNLRAPDVPISRNANQTVNRTSGVCHRRMLYLLRLLSRQPHIDPKKIVTEFQFTPATRPPEKWEERGTVTLAFSNK